MNKSKHKISPGIKQRIALEDAREIAAELIGKLKPSCDRIEIAGSIRRCKPTVGDIEIVCTPYVCYGMFGERDYDMPTQVLSENIKSMGSMRMIKDGPHYKQFIYRQAPIDLFITTDDQWPVIFTIRTGGASFSKALVTQRIKGGICPNDMYIKDGRLWIAGKDEPVEVKTEEDLFKVMGLNWVSPERRP